VIFSGWELNMAGEG